MRDTSLLAAILHTLALKSRGGLLFTEGEPDIGKSLLFSLELAYALQDGGLLRISDGRVQGAIREEDWRQLRLPDTIEGVVAGRLDRLSPAQQLVVKVASVVGRGFPLRLIQDVYPIPQDLPQVPNLMDSLTRLEIMEVVTPLPDLSYAFKYAITRDVAYSLMLNAQRQELHCRVAEWYGETFRTDLNPYLPLLAYHYEMAGNPSISSSWSPCSRGSGSGPASCWPSLRRWHASSATARRRCMP